MKVGVVSDTHGNVEWLTLLVNWLNNRGVEKIIHLGDDYDDTKKFVEMIKVPGIYDPQYKDENIPNRFIIEFDGWRVLLTHTKTANENDLPRDLKPEEIIKEGKCDVIFYGHTHIPELKSEGGIIYLNPGHLKPFDKKEYPASFGLVEFTPSYMNAKIVELQSKVIIKTKIFYKK